MSVRRESSVKKTMRCVRVTELLWQAVMRSSHSYDIIHIVSTSTCTTSSYTPTYYTQQHVSVAEYYYAAENFINFF